MAKQIEDNLQRSQPLLLNNQFRFGHGLNTGAEMLNEPLLLK